jgi:hypothetical protein
VLVGGLLGINPVVTLLRENLRGKLDVCVFLDACRDFHQNMRSNVVKDSGEYVLLSCITLLSMFSLNDLLTWSA